MVAEQNFEIQFAKIYPDFTKNLIQLNSDLTFTEVKICMYLRINFSNKQILEYMDISDSTLSNVRSSIRKKLNINRTQGLFNTITNL
jgi:DNA-binding CsgD family transcriptional regulator|tara:strand:+ start:458 stop:718 length:261 start_codon:yes stop_codon:yes gene_type:complete